MALKNSKPVALWVVPVPEFGGVARHVTDVARAGLPGYELVVLAPQGALTQRLEELGARVIIGNLGTEAGFLASVKTLHHTIAQEKPAVIHSHLAYADIVSCTVVNTLKIQQLVRRTVTVPKLFTTEHGIAGNDAVYHASAAKAKGRELIHRVRLLLTDRAIAVSRSTAEQMKLKWGARNVKVIDNGIDQQTLQAELAYAKSKQIGVKSGARVLSLSRLAPEKGLDILLLAFAKVLQKHPEACLEIAGHGELKDSLQSQAQELDISGSVEFPGFVNPVEAMARADVLAQLSIWENASYTLLDAKAAGLGLVATDVGGNSEIVSATELVPALNTTTAEQLAEKVAQKIIAALEHPHQQDFSWPTPAEMTQLIAEEYDKELDV